MNAAASGPTARDRILFAGRTTDGDSEARGLIGGRPDGLDYAICDHDLEIDAAGADRDAPGESK
jgi:hypothetical protein